MPSGGHDATLLTRPVEAIGGTRLPGFPSTGSHRSSWCGAFAPAVLAHCFKLFDRLSNRLVNSYSVHVDLSRRNSFKMGEVVVAGPSERLVFHLVRHELACP
ncbi:hypothetical protein LIA77_10242 [Sarocladium implicatum]|nr:hypothetical protein LIA77_10242 [Sarocladium implicatum]